MTFQTKIHQGNDYLLLLVGEEREGIAQQIAHQCTTVQIFGFDWNTYLSPWKAHKVFKNGEDFGGKADMMVREITSLYHQYHFERCSYRMIAGYSLAGLFSIYACTRVNLFDSCAAVSGSFWFPGFYDYLLEHKVGCDYVYLSVGDQESKTANPYLSTVQDQAMNINACIRAYTKCEFETNPGNHFHDEEGRMSKAVEKLLTYRVNK